jgi:uncharacterized protein YjbI with pentapeptide repeats
MTLRNIDSDRKSQLFIFLYENNVLPNKHFPNITLSLTGADLHGIRIESPVTGRYTFYGLILREVNLQNAFFINCNFINDSDFTGSAMSNITFQNSAFLPSSNSRIKIHMFDRVQMDYADFRHSTLSDVQFINANLSYSNFSFARLADITFTSNTLLIHSDWTHAQVEFINRFINTNLSGSILNVNQEGIKLLYNVVLPNGTWAIENDKNLLKNGDAEENVSFLFVVRSSIAVAYFSESRDSGIQMNCFCFSHNDCAILYSEFKRVFYSLVFVF